MPRVLFEDKTLETESSVASWAILALLFVSLIFSTLDRVALNLLVDPIKADLGITDTQFSVLQGAAFSLTYSLCAIPAGILADKVRRFRLIGAGAMLWGAMTALCGLASSYAGLIIARAGVGVGESVLSPSAYSILSDVFPKRKHALVFGIYLAGGSFGTGLSLAIGAQIYGWLDNMHRTSGALPYGLMPWQLTFVIVALPALMLGWIYWLLREPARQDREIGIQRLPALRAFYRDHRGFVILHHLAMGMCLLATTAGAAWVTAALSRRFGADLPSVGASAGLALMLGSGFGLIIGGVLGDILYRRGPAWRIILCAASVVMGAAIMLLFPMMPDIGSSLLVFAMMMGLGGLPLGAGAAALHLLVPGSIRGTVTANYFLVISLCGLLAPTLVAATSDTFLRSSASIGEALTLVSSVALFLAAAGFVASLHFYHPRRTDTDPGAESMSPTYASVQPGYAKEGKTI